VNAVLAHPTLVEWLVFSSAGPWENWDHLCTIYNLEDDVAFDAGNIVMTEPISVEPNITLTKEQTATSENTRSKRIISIAKK